ncbi:LysE family translocator [Arthrobacter sp. ISL-95]|uniref:LysE family translocator n=1 Tax=Arthrobacter sp. ISL-95 TaxID=2819116 RepID=UPI001BEB73BF|nr:LysE family translocator [Arthrobacter sp. ISL-95]MBT2585660.1 LysE family translocator [Arthrobacter sp. ISL-95]
MVTLSQATATALACVVLIAIPGPSVLFVIGRALSHGRANALASVMGNAIGCYTVGAAIAFGLGPLLERSELLFQSIKWVGILYLFWLGFQAIRHAGPVADGPEASVRIETPFAAVRAGTIVGLTNPKSFVLFTAIVPQFITPSAGNTSAQILILGIVPLLIGLITDTAWALAAGRARSWLAKSPRRMTTVGRVGGLSIIGVGISAAATGNRH